MSDGTFNVKIEGLSRLLKAFEKAPEEVGEVMQKAINTSAAILASNTDRRTVPFRRGDLIRSFKPVKIGKLFARWFPRVNYARAVQFGMPPSQGRYVPAIKRRLKNGPVSKIGMWPGFKGAHYMEKIRSASVNDINKVFKDALQEVVEILAKK